MDSKVEFLFLNEEDMIKAGGTGCRQSRGHHRGGHNTSLAREDYLHGRQSA